MNFNGFWTIVQLALLQAATTAAFSTVNHQQIKKPPSQRRTTAILHSSPPSNNQNNIDNEANKNEFDQINNRRNFLSNSLTTMGVSSSYVFLSPHTANALVKGNAPPPKKKSSDEQRKCTNVEECQEMAERLASQQEEEARLNAVPAQVAPKGTKYLEVVSVKDDSAGVVKEGDYASVHYKVLKLGKRSFDGLSGEGTVVFSRGEDTNC